MACMRLNMSLLFVVVDSLLITAENCDQLEETNEREEKRREANTTTYHTQTILQPTTLKPYHNLPHSTHTTTYHAQTIPQPTTLDPFYNLPRSNHTTTYHTQSIGSHPNESGLSSHTLSATSEACFLYVASSDSPVALPGFVLFWRVIFRPALFSITYVLIKAVFCADAEGVDVSPEWECGR
ncbi:hypothetical protein SARC_04994 [Sphaeroforma arctica JP610]|uniref:Uncharacterized protein n=1 Tax=Sphaeroforma arctica JP610 TaxID=667725 RepID=A0A0L0G3F1_9EUKA|nr:hypothetical protein SARC_04994 [Sphaeroforma arctica JP610]KNC82723.1 hypothetical protein SARC_04994 [Sphaeroforma arctica JP610]|eukprot:XP_014156625.1 hypothetical protein SARC_04994 [Sphaeroforma arctica JP610]